MKLKETNTELVLDSSSIDTCSDKVSVFLTGLKTDNKELLRIRLSIENILFRWQERFGNKAKFDLLFYSFLGQPSIQLRLAGEPCDPLDKTNEDMNAWSYDLLSSLKTMPVYAYSKNVNTVTFKLIKKERSQLVNVIVSLLAAVIVGSLGLLISKSFCSFATEMLLAPVCSAYLNVLNFFCIPLIFLSVTLGICGVGDVSYFSRIGKKMMRHFLLSLLIVIVTSAVTAYPFFKFTFGTHGVSTEFGNLLDTVIGFLPTSIVTPFVDCNAMQLIILGAIIGGAILKLKPAAQSFHDTLSGLNVVLLAISKWFTKLLPCFIFLIVVKSIWSEDTAKYLLVIKPLAITLALEAFFVFLTLLQISVKHKVSIFTIFKKISPTFFISFGTNSCGATIPEIYNCADKLGISPKISVFGIPIGTTLYKPGCAVRLVVLSYFMASIYGIEVSPLWFLTVFVMTFILSIAIPAIPGGALLFFPMLFSQLGIPSEAFSVAIAVDILFDALSTAVCQISAELALTEQAGSLSLLDEDTLRKKI